MALKALITTLILGSSSLALAHPGPEVGRERAGRVERGRIEREPVRFERFEARHFERERFERRHERIERRFDRGRR